MVQTWAYDAVGRVICHTDANGGKAYTFTYDRAGQETARQTSDHKGNVSAQRRTQYNLHGEVIGRGIGDTGWQEYAEYDNVGRAIKSNAEGGVTRAYLYDGNGNATMRIESQATDLRWLTLQQIMECEDAFPTFTVYDARNQATQVIQPKMELTGERLSVNSSWGFSKTDNMGLIDITLGSNATVNPNRPQLGSANGVLSIPQATAVQGQITFAAERSPSGAYEGRTYYARIPDLTTVLGEYDIELKAFNDTTNVCYGYGTSRDATVSVRLWPMHASDVYVNVYVIKKSTNEKNSIRGVWIDGTDSVNAAQYLSNLNRGMSPQQAAANTWTGNMAARYGYTNVGVPSTEYSSTTVIFGR